MSTRKNSTGPTTNVPNCAKCKKPVGQLVLNYTRDGLEFNAQCHNEQESVTIPVSFFQNTIGPIKISFLEAFVK